MDITAETIRAIVGLANTPQLRTINGSEYLIKPDGEYDEVLPETQYPAPIQLFSLDALVQMVRTEALPASPGPEFPVYIEAAMYNKVMCFLQPMSGLRYARPTLYETVASDVPGLMPDENIPFEQALIAVRTRFQQTPDAEYLLRLLSSITCGAKVTYAENGIATNIIAQKGVALQDTETVRPIVRLKPYRTFQEIDQPASEFHIRVSEKGIRFIEADGGMWKLTARKSIVEYLNENLAGEIADGRVVVML